MPFNEDVIKFTVFGQAQPAGSKRAFIQGGKAIVTDANKNAKPWQAEVKAAALEVFEGELLRGALHVRMTFCRPHPKSHYGTGRNELHLKRSAPLYPTTRPDALKLARAVEDALTGVIWADDSQIVTEELAKRYEQPARCIVEIREL